MKLKNKIKLSYWNVKLKNKYTIKTRQKKKNLVDSGQYVKLMIQVMRSGQLYEKQIKK